MASAQPTAQYYVGQTSMSTTLAGMTTAAAREIFVSRCLMGRPFVLSCHRLCAAMTPLFVQGHIPMMAATVVTGAIREVPAHHLHARSPVAWMRCPAPALPHTQTALQLPSASPPQCLQPVIPLLTVPMSAPLQALNAQMALFVLDLHLLTGVLWLPSVSIQLSLSMGPVPCSALFSVIGKLI